MRYGCIFAAKIGAEVLRTYYSFKFERSPGNSIKFHRELQERRELEEVLDENL